MLYRVKVKRLPHLLLSQLLHLLNKQLPPQRPSPFLRKVLQLFPKKLKPLNLQLHKVQKLSKLSLNQLLLLKDQKQSQL
jgi:hypothetical protein